MITEYQEKIVENYKTYLSELETNINISLNNLIKSYPNYKLYPDVSELENIYANDMSNLTENKNAFFFLNNDLETTNNNLLTIINTKNNTLNQLKNDKDTLNKTYTSIIDIDATSIGQRKQIRDEYQQNYLSLILLACFTGIFIISAYKQVKEVPVVSKI